VIRDQFARCPRCDCGLDQTRTRLTCGQCQGKLIPERELLDQISTEQAMVLLQPRTKNQTWMEFVRELPPPATVEEAPLACPRCGVAMSKHVLFAQIIDRCPAHGVWLDGEHELRTILAAAIEGF
jgi:hypothetical protein